jgi:hypothetical protein
MRFLPIYLIALVLFLSCGESDEKSATISATGDTSPSTSLTTIQWIDSAQNYGRINEGQKLAVSFRFKNSGSKPLVIQSVTPTCGCTVADYPKQPLAPGEEGEITGEFDSNGREGLQRKHITVVTNTNPAQQDVVFEVNVIGRPQAQQGQQSTSF